MSVRREGRGLLERMDTHRFIERIKTWHVLDRADEVEMSEFGVIGPIGPREECYAVYTGHNHIYFDGCDNELEPLWVLEQLRGTDQPRPMTEEEARSHPWMQRGPGDMPDGRGASGALDGEDTRP